MIVSSRCTSTVWWSFFCIVHVCDMDACSHFNGHPAAGCLITEPLVQIQAFPCTFMLLLPTKGKSHLKCFSWKLSFLAINTFLSLHTHLVLFTLSDSISVTSITKAFPSTTTLKPTDLAECVVLLLWSVKPDTHGTSLQVISSQCFWICLRCIFHQWFGYKCGHCSEKNVST